MTALAADVLLVILHVARISNIINVPFKVAKRAISAANLLLGGLEMWKLFAEDDNSRFCLKSQGQPNGKCFTESSDTER